MSEDLFSFLIEMESDVDEHVGKIGEIEATDADDWGVGAMELVHAAHLRARASKSTSRILFPRQWIIWGGLIAAGAAAVIAGAGTLALVSRDTLIERLVIIHESTGGSGREQGFHLCGEENGCKAAAPDTLETRQMTKERSQADPEPSKQVDLDQQIIARAIREAMGTYHKQIEEALIPMRNEGIFYSFSYENQETIVDPTLTFLSSTMLATAVVSPDEFDFPPGKPLYLDYGSSVELAGKALGYEGYFTYAETLTLAAVVPRGDQELYVMMLPSNQAESISFGGANEFLQVSNMSGAFRITITGTGGSFAVDDLVFTPLVAPEPCSFGFILSGGVFIILLKVSEKLGANIGLSIRD